MKTVISKRHREGILYCQSELLQSQTWFIHVRSTIKVKALYLGWLRDKMNEGRDMLLWQTVYRRIPSRIKNKLIRVDTVPKESLGCLTIFNMAVSSGYFPGALIFCRRRHLRAKYYP